jgi:hypothetical protein
MATVVTDSKHYSNIASTIRDKTGLGTQYKPEEMPGGIEEVFEAGRKAEYDFFWDNYQQNGARTSYNYAFREWIPILLKPKYDIVPKNATGTFYATFNRLTGGASLKECLDKAGVVLDTSNTINLTSFCGYSNVTDMPAISTVSVTALDRIFDNARLIKTIDKLILREDGTQTFTSVFTRCDALENLTIEGVIGQNGFDVSQSKKLTHDSLMSIINALQDKTPNTSGTSWVVTLGTDNLAKLSDSEKAVATQKGWTLA